MAPRWAPEGLLADALVEEVEGIRQMFRDHLHAEVDRRSR
jgi:hypothetical protein